MSATREVAAALRDRLSDELRVVGAHDGTDWHVEYMREDVQEDYGADSIDHIAGDLALEVVSSARQETLYELGDLRAQVRLFEDGFVVHVPVEDRSGYLVSMDDGADVRGREVVELVRELDAE
ncbi:DUF7522 family protein [Halobacterium yunchengense]|uniref:DUF7522 family protein n=1 Tax=Halobacterium yunchengense TaxID=3108497 RepID=UPI00300AB453